MTPEIGAKLSAAAQRLAAGDRRASRALCEEIVRLAPDVSEAHYILGEIALQDGDAAGALVHLDRSIGLKPEFARPKAARARALAGAGGAEEAVAAARELGRTVGADAYTLDTAGVVLTGAGLHVEAVELYARAAKGARWTGYWHNYAAALQFLGRMEEARSAYREALKLDESNALAWAGLVQITKQTREANEIGRLTKLAEAVRGDAKRLHTVGHAMAKAYEDVGEGAQSLAWLERAKAPWRGTYDAGADAARFDAAVRSAGMELAGGLRGARPIFVVGMPRTGTTLVERILTSHSEVEAAGETNHFVASMRRAAGMARGVITDQTIDTAAGADSEAIGAGYMNAVRATQGFAGRFVDKQPFNAFLAAHILRALPEARVVALRRHPADVVLSSYRQEFAAVGGLLDYTFDLEATARYYVRFDAMMRVFAERLPKDRFCEVAYEDVVSDLEGQTRRMLEFCGLGFEKACLQFDKNASPVATASAAQVRQPLYASSVGRWTKYRPAIDPALKVLVEGGVMTASELG